MITPEAQDRLNSVLEPDETIIWSDQPVPGSALQRSSAQMTICTVGLIIGGFLLILGILGSLPNAATEVVRSGPDYMPGYHTVTVNNAHSASSQLIGLGLVLTALMVGVTLSTRSMCRIADRAVYAVTDQRVIIIPGANGAFPALLEPLLVKQQLRQTSIDGDTNILFPNAPRIWLNASTPTGSYGGRRYHRATPPMAGFWSVGDADAAEAALRQLVGK